MRLGRYLLTGTALFFVSFLSDAVVATQASNASTDNSSPSNSWLGWGGGIFNNRWASTTQHITSANIAAIRVRCRLPYPGGLGGTPTIYNGKAYYSTWNGTLVALDYESCTVSWQINVTQLIEDFAPIPAVTLASGINPVSRTSPLIDTSHNLLYFGTQTHALLVAVDLRTGQVRGVTQLHSHPLAILTNSGTLYNGIIYTGTSSLEEVGIIYPDYTCCSFIGTAVAVRFDPVKNTFIKLWETPMLPPSNSSQGGAWAGASVWGSQPPIDTTRKQVYFATGNVYTVPDALLPCTVISQNATAGNDTCLPDRVWSESILALNMYTGHPNWIRRMSPLDAWTYACGGLGSPRNPALCPQNPGRDTDFGMAPTFVPGGGSGGEDILTIGQKSGQLHSLAAENGELRWSVNIGPGGLHGGLSWGISVDNEKAYFTEINADGAEFTLTSQTGGTGAVINNSAFGSVWLANGSIAWETAAPRNEITTVIPSTVGDIILTGTTNDTSGALLAIHKRTGQQLLEVVLDSFLAGGISVVDRFIFLGTGYRGTSDGSFYVLEVE
ncbi:Quino protein alcohol dehydrogenase-like protein [Thozetella sp. PMI_491]|nr:Quino protein alcohol dehydrogenase-like protein [Thozetella sp. PMI_491]